MSEQAAWYDWVMIVVFLIHFVGALLWGGRFLHLGFRTRLVWSIAFTLTMFGWVLIHRL